MLQKAVIIGTGNVAWQLAHCLPLCGCCVLQIFGRNAHKAESLALEVGAEHTDSYRDIYPNADFYIYAVADDALPEVVDNVETDAGIHLHTSGSVDIAVFEGKRSNYGVLYPLQTFTRGRMVDFGRVAIFTEANSADNLRRIGEFARRLSLKVFDVDSRQRRRVSLRAISRIIYGRLPTTYCTPTIYGSTTCCCRSYRRRLINSNICRLPRLRRDLQNEATRRPSPDISICSAIQAMWQTCMECFLALYCRNGNYNQFCKLKLI